MQILITHAGISRTRVITLHPVQLALMAFGLLLLITLTSGAVYHFIFLKAAREGWPVVSPLIKLIVRDEFAQRDRYVRENLDAMAQRLGQVQAKLVRIDAMSERLSTLAGVAPEALPVSPVPDGTGAVRAQTAPVGATGATAPAPNKTSTGAVPTSPKAAQGGPFVPFAAIMAPNTPGPEVSAMDELSARAANLDALVDQRADVLTFIESHLLEAKLRRVAVPSTVPVQGAIASGFGFRLDPFTGRAALHTGLDFPSPVGTPIVAAAGGVVVNLDPHPQYGNVVELDHGSGLVTRYAHASKRLVQVGEIVKRGQLIAQVGNTGRSTGPHLHFEVLIDGVPQNPAKFLALDAATSR
jgi:murein DD-endopeptidase MepM/ murein hydrolase activator NlpD